MPGNDSKDPALTSLDQIVFVTGANGGIGASMMHAYAQGGATVIGADRTGRGPDAAAAYYDLDVTEVAALVVLEQCRSAAIPRRRGRCRLLVRVECKPSPGLADKPGRRW